MQRHRLSNLEISAGVQGVKKEEQLDMEFMGQLPPQSQSLGLCSFLCPAGRGCDVRESSGGGSDSGGAVCRERFAFMSSVCLSSFCFVA